MRLDRNLPRRPDTSAPSDPRDAADADPLDLATRRVMPAVSQRRPGTEMFGLAAGVAIVALLGGATLWSLDSARLSQAAPPTATPAPAPPPSAPLPAPTAQAPVIPEQALTPLGSPLVGDPSQMVLAAPPQSTPMGSTGGSNLASPTVIFDAGALPPPSGSAISSTSLGNAGPGPGSAPGNSNEDFANRLGASADGSAVAAASIDPRSTVTQGTLIPAVLETAIDTDVPGYVRAVVSADVRSFDGSRILVPRSSRLIGQYKSGLQAGQKRAYVIWTRLIRPDGVSVNIASPAVGFEGGTGLPGKVDTRFFERFGSAMLLSVLGGLSAIGGNSGVVIAAGGQSAAAAAVGQTAQISPNIRVRQGQPIRVFTARDLDFSKVSNQ